MEKFAKRMPYVLTHLKHTNVAVSQATIKELMENASKVGMLAVARLVQFLVMQLQVLNDYHYSFF